jgi:glycosyltransferase involved in cell wall biosynthesis
MPIRSSVSVVIPAFNSAKYLDTAIDSALNQTVPPLEVLVVNDGSIDNTEDVIAEYRGSIRSFYQENSGPAVARNRAIAEAKGDLIAFLDADDIWALDKLERQLAHAKENPEARVIHTAFYHLQRDTGEISQPFPPKYQRLISGRCYSDLFLGNKIRISTVLVYKACFRVVGGFDESVRRASTEDYDLWLRLARYYKFGYIDIPLMYYGQHPTSASSNRGVIVEGDLYVLRKALRSDPALKGLVGASLVRDRLFGVFYDIGCAKHDEDNHAGARAYFLDALRCRPWEVHTWLLVIAHCLPPALFQRIRAVKRMLDHVNRTQEVSGITNAALSSTNPQQREHIAAM